MEHMPGRAPEHALHAVHVCTQQDEAMGSACFLCVCAAGVSSSNMPVQVVSKEAKCAHTGIEQGAVAP